jgi:hypothetical protein
MFLASKRLASYRKMDKGVGIGDGSGPTEPLPIFFACMTAIVPRVNVLKNNASFVWQYTSHQSVISASLEQPVINKSIMSYPMT